MALTLREIRLFEIFGMNSFFDGLCELLTAGLSLPEAISTLAARERIATRGLRDAGVRLGADDGGVAGEAGGRRGRQEFPRGQVAHRRVLLRAHPAAHADPSRRRAGRCAVADGDAGRRVLIALR